MPDSVYIKSTKFEDFDPNHLNTEQPLWAVYDGYHFKTFSRGRGPAIQAFNSERKAKLYQMVNNLWVEVAAKDPDSHDIACEICGKDAVESYAAATYGSYRRPERPFVFERHGSKIASPLRLRYFCRTCNTMWNS